MRTASITAPFDGELWRAGWQGLSEVEADAGCAGGFTEGVAVEPCLFLVLSLTEGGGVVMKDVLAEGFVLVEGVEEIKGALEEGLLLFLAEANLETLGPSR